MKNSFEAFCAIDGEDAIKLANELVAQQGTIDMEIEGLASRENQRDLTIKFHWGTITTLETAFQSLEGWENGT